MFTPAELNAFVVDGGRTLEIALELTNFLGEVGSSPSPFSLNVSAFEIPTVEILGADEQTTTRLEAVKVQAVGSATTCDNRTTPLEYVWTLRDDQGEIVLVNSTSWDPKEFTLDPGALDVGSYELVLRVG